MSSCEIIEGITLHHGDCRDIMRALPADHFDAIITDPPYGIAFKGEKWDTATPRGFQAWCESWATEALRILKPGGYLLAFSAPRTYHRLTAGIEDAGFAIRDAMAWIRADGKPSGVDLSAAFDRAAGVLNQRKGRDIREWAESHRDTHVLTQGIRCWRAGHRRSQGVGGVGRRAKTRVGAYRRRSTPPRRPPDRQRARLRDGCDEHPVRNGRCWRVIPA